MTMQSPQEVQRLPNVTANVSNNTVLSFLQTPKANPICYKTPFTSVQVIKTRWHRLLITLITQLPANPRLYNNMTPMMLQNSFYSCIYVLIQVLLQITIHQHQMFNKILTAINRNYDN